MHRKSSIASAFLLLGSTSIGFAADLPTAKPVPYYAPPLFTWTGFYVGLNAGAAWGSGGNVTVAPTINGVTQISEGGRSGFAGGGQAGFNIQSGAFVYGIETDLDGVAISHHNNCGPYGFICTGNNGGGWLGTTRARLGYAMDQVLIYATGGVAYGGLNSQPIGGNASSNVGWTAGGGVEYAFDPHWTVKLEALYVNLNVSAKTVQVTDPVNGIVYTASASGTGNGGGIVRAGLNYKF
jgi:outer membrane immunogenic protein